MNERYQLSWWEKKHFEQQYDLIVIGAGLTGLFSALFYKRKNPDHNVLVLERGYFPDGASSRNAGFACFGSASELLDDLSHESEDAVFDRLSARLRGLGRLRNEMGDAALDFEQPGGLELFTDKSAFREASGKLDLFNSWLREISGQEQVYRTTTFLNYNAIYCSLEGRIDSGLFMKSLVEKTLGSGVDIRWNTGVSGLAKGCIKLHTGPDIRTQKILIATNGFTSDLVENTGIRPARGYIFVTKPIRDLAWKGIFHYDRGYYYFRDLPDNRLLIGGARNFDFKTEETTSRAVNTGIRNHLVEFADRVLGLPEGWAIEHEWTGTMGFGPTKTPVCRKMTDGIYVAAGLSGMGVAIGTDLATRVSEMMMS
jgi:gamma-glutamylputrescine oxidase